MKILSGLAGFIGSWLLVAGSLYQALLELRSEDIEADRIRATARNVTAPPKVSLYWWLIPPIKMVLERKRTYLYRRAYIKALTPEDAEALITFINKATAWVYVATGGVLLAAKETYELNNLLGFSLIVFWIAVVVMLIACIGNIISQARRSKELLI